MAVKLEDQLPGVKQNGLVTAKPAVFTGTVNFSGATITNGASAVFPGTLTAGGNTANFVQVGTSAPLIYTGSGAPTISAAVKGSLYLRSDGSSTSTRAYIATDTAGTWTAITTAG